MQKMMIAKAPVSEFLFRVDWMIESRASSMIATYKAVSASCAMTADSRTA